MKTNKINEIKNLLKPDLPAMINYAKESEMIKINNQELSIGEARRLYPGTAFVKTFPGDQDL